MLHVPIDLSTLINGNMFKLALMFRQKFSTVELFNLPMTNLWNENQWLGPHSSTSIEVPPDDRVTECVQSKAKQLVI